MKCIDVIEKIFESYHHCRYYNPGDKIYCKNYIGWRQTGLGYVIFVGSNEGQIDLKIFKENEGIKFKNFLNLLME